MKIAIMQPYLFPYIGYYQLIAAVDKFVVYDDVAFIKQGWINRNRILVNKTPYMFTVPLQNASSFCKISDTLIDSKLYQLWIKKFLKTLDQNYNKASFYEPIRSVILEIFKRDYTTIAELSRASLQQISEYIYIDTEFVGSSSIYNNSELKSEDRVIDICLHEQATVYINSINGADLYSKENFKQHNIDLLFISPTLIPYNQSTIDFVSHLSIIDVLMFNSKEDIKRMIQNFILI
ncbi:WbqC family protein [Hymenobacter sp. HDW8]|uniref:WbqC family protein n=1 Tax=Hymenobacter sp. HDW8 TaxID=2714932 RepID=UPI0014076E3D|nr:WbqC family protein [Hymenobacter sp. HDW8]QIL76400.1 WbqC family protein [Hymenobacter sp. HDW8]